MTSIPLSPELSVLVAFAIGSDEQLNAALAGLATGAGAGGGPPAFDWSRFEWLARANHLAGPVAARLRGLGPASARALAIPDGVAAALGADLPAHHALYMAQSAIAARLTARIEAAGGRVLVLKGITLGQALYPQAPHLRGASDIDLLIAPDQLDLADAILTGAGLERRWPRHMPQGPAREMFMLLANAFDYVDPVSGQLVELHHRITLNPGWMDPDFEAAYATSEAVATPAGTIRGLGGPFQLRYLCWHGFSHMGFRLKWFCDIVGTLRQIGADTCLAACPTGPGRRPLELADALIAALRAALPGEPEPVLPRRLAERVRRIVADMEDPSDLPSDRQLASLPAEIGFRAFLARLSPGWRAKG